jgi:hypothetical protein
MARSLTVFRLKELSASKKQMRNPSTFARVSLQGTYVKNMSRSLRENTSMATWVAPTSVSSPATAATQIVVGSKTS